MVDPLVGKTIAAFSMDALAYSETMGDWRTHDGVDFACVWDEDTVRQIRDAGLKTMVWTVDDVDTAERYYAMGVRDFTTNTLTPGKPQPGPGERFEWARRFVRLALERIFRPLEKLFARAC